MTSPLMTTAEAAEQLGIKPWTLTRLARSGAISCTQRLDGVRGARLFSPADLRKYKASTRTRHPTR